MKGHQWVTERTESKLQQYPREVSGKVTVESLAQLKGASVPPSKSTLATYTRNNTNRLAFSTLMESCSWEDTKSFPKLEVPFNKTNRSGPQKAKCSRNVGRKEESASRPGQSQVA